MLQVSKTYDSFIERPTEFDNALNEKRYDNTFMRNKVLNCTHHKTYGYERKADSVVCFLETIKNNLLYKSTQYA